MTLLSDLTWAFLQPGGIILILLLLSFLLLLFGALRTGRRLLGCALLAAVLPGLLPLEDMLAAPLERRLLAPNPLPAQVTGILVLGGSVEPAISNARGQLNLNDASERVIAGAALAERYPGAKLVFTGLYRETVANDFLVNPNAKSLFFGAEYGGRELVFLGTARSTYEEALLSIEALKPRAGETWLLVTSAYHMPRAFLTFQAQGWTLVPYPVDYRSRARPVVQPSLTFIGKLADLDEIFREWGALFVYNRLGRTDTLLP